MERDQLVGIARELDPDVWAELRLDSGPVLLSVRGRVTLVDHPEELIELLQEQWIRLGSEEQLALRGLVLYGSLPGPLDRELLECLEDSGFYDVEELALTSMGIAAVHRFAVLKDAPEEPEGRKPGEDFDGALRRVAGDVGADLFARASMIGYAEESARNNPPPLTAAHMLAMHAKEQVFLAQDRMVDVHQHVARMRPATGRAPSSGLRKAKSLSEKLGRELGKARAALEAFDRLVRDAQQSGLLDAVLRRNGGADGDA